MKLRALWPRRSPGRTTRTGAVLFLSGLALLTGCNDILDVENPNNLVQEDLGNPAAASSIVNGASATLARGIGAMLGPYETVTDEVVWVGSRDAWRELDQGFLTNEKNEFTDDAFRFINEGRFMTDEAIRRLEAFDAEKQLTDRNLLAQAYLYGAIAYVTAADMFDRFVISDRREASPPVPSSEMIQLYDQAIDYLTQGLVIARATKSTTLEANLLGMRARAHFSKEVWRKLNPEGTVAPDPLVNSAEANADATAALALMPADYEFILTLANDDLAYAGEASLAYNINQRGELGIAPVYGKLGRTVTVSLQDPIDNVPDPVLTRALNELNAVYVNQEITIISAREMRLILAEAALARGDMAGFGEQINAIRALDRLTPFSGQLSAVDLLEHERRVNLFLQGRRLADQYRFGTPAPEWQPNSTAATRPGTFFPITCIEIRAHPQDFPDVNC